MIKIDAYGGSAVPRNEPAWLKGQEEEEEEAKKGQCLAVFYTIPSHNTTLALAPYSIVREREKSEISVPGLSFG